jgi:hypothetical protein
VQDGGSTKIQIHNNRFEDCNYGIYSGNATYSIDGTIIGNTFKDIGTNAIFISKISSPLIQQNNFCEYGKNVNDKSLLQILNIDNNLYADIGLNQRVEDQTKAVAILLGYIGAGQNNILLNTHAEWESGANNFWSELISICGRGGVTNIATLNSDSGGTVITGITLSIATNNIYATVSASASATTNDITFLLSPI